MRYYWCDAVQARQTVRSTMIYTILATDMSKHFDHLAKVKAREHTWDREDVSDRKMLMETVIHAADLGHVTFDFKLNFKFSTLVNAEFNAQVRRIELWLSVVPEYLCCAEESARVYRRPARSVSLTFLS